MTTDTLSFWKANQPYIELISKPEALTVFVIEYDDNRFTKFIFCEDGSYSVEINNVTMPPFFAHECVQDIQSDIYVWTDYRDEIINHPIYQRLMGFVGDIWDTELMSKHL